MLLTEEMVQRTASKKPARAAPCIRCEPAPGITNSQRSQSAAAVFVAVDIKAFHAGRKVSAPKVLQIHAAAKSVVLAQEFVLTLPPQIDVLVGVKIFRLSVCIDVGYIGVFSNGVSIRKERIVIPDMKSPRVRRKHERAPEIEVPFVSPVKLTYRRSRLHHFFFLAGIFFGAGIKSRYQSERCAKGKGQFFHNLAMRLG